MTPRRQRMIAALQLRGLSARTQEMSVRAVRQLADHSHTSPDRITAEELRDSCLARKHDQHASHAASPIALCGIKFFDAYTLKRAWTPLTFVRPPQAHQLPVILNLSEVHTLLPCVRLPRYRTCLRTIYACGLRLQAGPHLQGPDMDRARMVVHGRDGTGAKDRSVPRPQQTLTLLRHDGKTPRNPVWLFPAPGRSGLGMAPASTPRPRPSGHDALRAALRASGLHQRASVHPWRPSWATHRLEAGVHLRLMQPSLGPTSPATPALSTHLTVTADALAPEAITRLLDALSGSWEDCHARTGGDLPTLWPGLAHPMR